MPKNFVALEQAQMALLDMGMKFGPRLVVALLIIMVGFYAGRWIGVAFDRWLSSMKLELPVRVLLVRVARLLVLGLFVVMALQNLGVDLLPLIAGLSVVGAGVALAMQGVLGNLAAGLTIIFTRPFRIGEYIAVAGVEGQVTSIELFTTKLIHSDLSEVVIPNRKIVGEILHNYGQIRQLDLSLGLVRGEDLEVSLRCVREAVRGESAVLTEPPAVIGVRELGDRSITIAIRPWVKVQDFVGATGRLNGAVASALRAAGVTYPASVTDIHVVKS